MLAAVAQALCGAEPMPLPILLCKSARCTKTAWMPVDSTIERTTVDGRTWRTSPVFAKLPRINIPAPSQQV